MLYIVRMFGDFVGQDGNAPISINKNIVLNAYSDIAIASQKIVHNS